MISIFCTQALEHALAELAPDLEQAAGQAVSPRFGTTGALVAELRAGASADVVIVSRAALDKLEADGLISGPTTDIASTGIGLAVAAGRPHPDISTPDALRGALVAARAVAYPDPADGGASGIHFAAVLDRLGIAEAIAAKAILVKAGGEVGRLAASGETELAVQMISELLPVPGTEIIGPLPQPLQAVTTFAAGYGRDSGPARAVIATLRGDKAAAIMTHAGLEPL